MITSHAAAFVDYQKQMRELRLMGLKMAGKFLPKARNGAPK